MNVQWELACVMRMLNAATPMDHISVTVPLGTLEMVSTALVGELPLTDAIK